MLIDTHCHVNIMIKKKFADAPMNESNYRQAKAIIQEACQAGVSPIINVGTSVVESTNCVEIAKQNNNTYAVVGIHPNDISTLWKDDLKAIQRMLSNKKHNNIVGVGECGFDFHYPDFNKQKQHAVFKAQIELALEHNVALVVHSRDAYDETLVVLEEYKNESMRSVMHCFSYDYAYAAQVIEWGCVLGIGGTITYPRNEELRTVVHTHSLEHIVLETDAPFLPPQIIRGKKNHPRYIVTIAEYIAQLKNVSFKEVAMATTTTARTLFAL